MSQRRTSLIVGAAVGVGAVLLSYLYLRKRVTKTAQPQYSSSRPVLVGVCGGSGSGKTTVVDHLQDLLKKEGIGVTVLAQDSYYKDLSHLNLDARARSNFDHPDSIDFELFYKQLAQLQAGKSISRPSYDFKTHCRCTESQNIILEPSPVIIVDGILSLHDKKLRSLYDMSVFVSVSENKRLERRAERDVRVRGRDRASVEMQFKTTVAPMHSQFVEPTKTHASVVLDWEHEDGHAAKGQEQVNGMVVEPLVRLVKQRLEDIRAADAKEAAERKSSSSS